jgi:hypothetical protein
LFLQNPEYDIKVVTTQPALHFFKAPEVEAEVISDEDEWNVSALGSLLVGGSAESYMPFCI